MGKVLHITIDVLVPKHLVPEGSSLVTDTKVFVYGEGGRHEITKDVDVEETDRYEEEAEN